MAPHLHKGVHAACTVSLSPVLLLTEDTFGALLMGDRPPWASSHSPADLQLL